MRRRPDSRLGGISLAPGTILRDSPDRTFLRARSSRRGYLIVLPASSDCLRSQLLGAARRLSAKGLPVTVIELESGPQRRTS